MWHNFLPGDDVGGNALSLKQIFWHCAAILDLPDEIHFPPTPAKGFYTKVSHLHLLLLFFTAKQIVALRVAYQIK